MWSRIWKEIAGSGALVIGYVAIVALLFYPVLEAGGYLTA
jgi:hypothetical protein